MRARPAIFCGLYTPALRAPYVAFRLARLPPRTPRLKTQRSGRLGTSGTHETTLPTPDRGEGFRKAPFGDTRDGWPRGVMPFYPAPKRKPPYTIVTY